MPPRGCACVTVCRRYSQLRQNLLRLKERSLAELGYPLPVAVVWARPLLGHLWYFRQLEREGLYTHLLPREALPGEQEGRATTYPESHSLRRGLDFLRQTYSASSWAVALAADVWLQEGTLAFLNGKLASHQACVFFWQNSCCGTDCWHTNCFGVRLEDDSFWPPVVGPTERNTLERAWGLCLKGREGVFRWHNSGARRFIHAHPAERELPRVPLCEVGTLSLSLRGYQPWWQRLWLWLRGIFFRLS